MRRRRARCDGREGGTLLSPARALGGVGLGLREDGALRRCWLARAHSYGPSYGPSCGGGGAAAAAIAAAAAAIAAGTARSARGRPRGVALRLGDRRERRRAAAAARARGARAA